MLLLLGTYFARDASYAHEYTDVRVPENVNKHDNVTNGLSSHYAADNVTNGLSTLSPAADDNNDKCTELRVLKLERDSGVTEHLVVVDDDDDCKIKITDKTDDTDYAKALSAMDNGDNRDATRQLRVMVAARVFVGRYTTGHRTYRRPPPLDPALPHSASFDSCVNYVDDPTLFVIFDSSQCYPEYFITYWCQSE